MKVLKLFVLFLTVLGVASYANATGSEPTQPANKLKIKEEVEFQEVIDEYKSYAAKVDPTVRDEVITYRKEIAKLNKQKRLLYRKLSQDAQEYLKQEQQFKKRLPKNKQALLKSGSEDHNKDEGK